MRIRKGSFNPCFIGLYIPTWTIYEKDIREWLGFNPCFIGLYIPTCGESTLNFFVLQVSILVLLDCIYLLLLIDELMEKVKGFNPCFIGLYIPTGKEEAEKYYQDLFQSLFYWIVYTYQNY